MKLQMEVPSLIVGQAVEEEQFAIGNLAVILHLLRSKMYSNPIRTIVQEIASNARDANREAGKRDKPIFIHLPTKEEPEIWIQDEGPGISPQRMSGVYLQYGNSTKRESEDETGCYGLGAKSPFAYASSFGIETITPDADGNHILRVYIATVDQSQIGKVLLVNTVQTDKPCGTTIKVPVKPEDMEEFKRWTDKVLNRWNPLPNTNVKNVFSTISEPDISGDGWEVITSKNLEHGVFYYEDGIPYEVERESLPEIVYNHHLQPFFKKVRVNLFGKGDVLVTGNRESLDYQPQVIAHLMLKLESIYTEVNQRLTQKVQNCTGLWEAMCMIHKQSEVWGVDILKNVMWGGQPVPNIDSYHIYHAEIFDVTGDSKRVSGVRIKRRNYGFSPRPSNMVIANHTKGRPNAAYVKNAWEFTKKHFEDIGISNYNLFIISWLDNDEAQKEKEKFRYSEWGLKTLEEFKPERKPRIKGQRHGYGSVCKIRQFYADSYSGASYEERWEKTEVDLQNEAGGVYVLLHSRNLDEDFGEDAVQFFCKETSQKVYGIPRRFAFQKGVLALGPQWIPLKKAVSNELDKLIVEHGNVIALCEYSVLPSNYLQSDVFSIVHSLVKAGEVNGKIGRWFKLERNTSLVHKMTVMAKICDREADLSISKVSNEHVKEIAKIFPLLFMWNGIRYDSQDLIAKEDREQLLKDFIKRHINEQEAAEKASLAAQTPTP